MVGKKDWADLWLESDEFVTVKAEIEELKLEGLSHEETVDPHEHNECAYSLFPHGGSLADLLTADATTFAFQMDVVVRRTFLSFWRNPDYGFTRRAIFLIFAPDVLFWLIPFLAVFNHMAVALFVGLTFLNLNNSLASLQYRVFAIFFITVRPLLPPFLPRSLSLLPRSFQQLLSLKSSLCS